ncbi:MAG: hypothetical protein CL930_04735 [Deltaproteobacteria bacterium]|nr:hypothetical protein [Deltaproteobacteria bacterium]
MKVCTWLFLFVAVFLSPAQAAIAGDLYAEKSSSTVSEKVTIKVWTVHASNSHKEVDERLKRISKYLKNLNYAGFKLLSKDAAQLEPKGKQKFQIAGGKTVKVTVLSRDEKRARVRVEVHGSKGKLVDTTVNIRRNGLFMVAGPKHKGGILVLPIFARY